MTQKSFHWNGASIGDADALTVNAADGIGFRLANVDYESPWVDIGLRMLFNGTGNRGVLKGWLNELVVAAGGGMTVTVDTGGAVIYGMPYENTTAGPLLTFTLDAAVSDTRYDYIVLRRNWADQEIRATVIKGVEGGSAPAITQSPAPGGTGIYDIPLATVEVTTVPAIGTITDMREFCRFGTVMRTGALGTAHLTNDSIDWADRATTTKRAFIGGGDLQPMNNAGRFSYYVTTNILMAGAPVWDGAANEEAWQHVGTNYRGVIGTFRTPPDYAGGAINTYIWWANNVLVAATFYVRSYVAARGRYWGTDIPSISSSEYTTASGAVSDVFRSTGSVLPAASIALNGADGVWNYWTGLYNTAGTEDIGIMGVEIEYTGYV